MNILGFIGGGERGGLGACVGTRLDAAVPGFARRAHVLAGTSIGSIMACWLAAGKPWLALLRLFEDQSRIIFSRGPGWRVQTGNGAWGAKWPSDGLRSVIEREFGELTLGDLKQTVFIPAVDLDSRDDEPGLVPRRRKAIFMHNWPGSRHLGVRVVDACMRSAAAPVYFPSHDGCWDGGLVANDPTLYACVEASKQARAAGRQFSFDDVSALTIGTGLFPHYIEGSPNYGPLGAIQPVLDVALDEGAACLGHACSELVGKYELVQPWLPREIPLDDAGAIPELEQLAQATDLRAAITLVSGW